MVRGVHAFFTMAVPPRSRVESKLQASESPDRIGGLMKTFVVAFAALLTGCLAVTAHAATPARNVQHQVVPYGDLNLASQADAAILRGRVTSAARSVCGLRQAMPLPLEIQTRLEACAHEATARALADVDASEVKRHGEVVVRNAFE
jgi:UrcA family protein